MPCPYGAGHNFYEECAVPIAISVGYSKSRNGGGFLLRNNTTISKINHTA